MIDVIFLLLIFFMSTLSFNPPEGLLDSQLVQAGLTADKDIDFEPILIRLMPVKVAEGREVQIICDQLNMEDISALKSHLVRRREIADVPVVVQGGKSVPFGLMAAVLDTCHGVDLRQVAFSPKTVGE